MMSIKNILTISKYESKVLWRNWFFRIVALAGIFFIGIFNLVEMSSLDNPSWWALLNGFVLPYASVIFISIPQAAAVIFLGTGLIKKDKKLDTNEVFFVRAISNLDYVFGKALAMFKLFFLLNLVILLIPFIVGLTNPMATVNPMAFIIAPLLTSVPSIVFTMGIAFLLVTLIRNQPISIVLLIGIAGVQLIYYFDKFSNILDFTGFRISMLSSEMSGFVDIEFALWQRTFFLVTGIALLFLTAFLLDRLSGDKTSHRASAIIGVMLLGVSSFIMYNLWTMRQSPIDLRQEMITVNDQWTSVPNLDVSAHSIALEWAGMKSSVLPI
jgi:Phosphoglycerol transferase and related proteins, alkaline phosphatase superfamily